MLGEQTSATDPAGNKTTTAYDFLGRKTVTTAADGTSTATSYDTAGNPVQPDQRDTKDNTPDDETPEF